MRLAMLVIGSAALFAVLGLLMMVAVTPIEFYAGEICGELSGLWFFACASVGLAAAVAAAALVIGVPIAALVWYGKKRR